MSNNRFANRDFSGGSGGNKSGDVDWPAYNQHIVTAVNEATGIEEGNPCPVIAYISGIVDVGVHQDPVQEEQYVQVGKDEEKGNARRKKIMEKGEGELFIAEADGQQVEMIRYTPKPSREVVYFVDIPSITVDKGQFFGDSNPAPYRLLWGSDFNKIPNRPVKVQGYKSNNKWMCGDGSFHNKMARAAGINTKDGFAQDDILQLIGKPIMVTLEVFINKDGFLKEKVSNPVKIFEGISIPEYDDSLLFYVGFFDAKNTEQDIKFLPTPVKRYMAMASNWDVSAVKKQLEAAEGKGGDTTENSQQEPAQEPTQQESQQGHVTPEPPGRDDFDEDSIPF